MSNEIKTRPLTPTEQKYTRKSLVIWGILIVNNIVDKVDKSTKTYKFKTERSG